MIYALIILVFITGLSIGVFLIKNVYEEAFRCFRDDMYIQYIMLIKLCGINENREEYKDIDPCRYYLEIPVLNRRVMR